MRRRWLSLALFAATLPGGCGLPPAPPLDADRGIGGTGIDVADRGIGGTGIVGVVGKDGTLAIAGRQIGTNAVASVHVDGLPAGLDALRPGQVVAVAAQWQQDRLQARTLAVRHEVSGPVEEVAAEGDRIVVAGQTVRLEGADSAPRRGEWVAVSGLRDAEGVIRASRVDQRRPGEVSVSGLLEADGRGWRLGALAVRGAVLPPAGQRIRVTGRYVRGVLQVRSAGPDPLLDFPPAIDRFLVEAYPRSEGGRLWLVPGLSVVMAPSFTLVPTGGPLVIALTLEADRGLVATGVQEMGGGQSDAGSPGAAPGGPGQHGSAGHGGMGNGPGAAPGGAAPGGGGPGNAGPGSDGPGGAGGPGGGPGGVGGPGGGGPGNDGPGGGGPGGAGGPGGGGGGGPGR
ncbi:conserved protein of unknown function [Rhodovastum atsumiense]|uniref:DUF5666 domain-containing protein n=1 Tax=Rhodovastum atsumiense TaxID=504468 RepID=A0A5M6IRP1_9PROT|nr:DUF5666 domain-containing protein [Rhodovastum atsumiense]KAA5610238.1 hypothetical protein F1189_20510 [Rhodovastum atsumiense]CAH2604140.1 conserved protein of unknown function [Rhodovastum atsumiense]